MVHRLMVYPNYEGKGVARSLIELVEKLAKENGYTTIRLVVFSENTSTVNFSRNRATEYRGRSVLEKESFFVAKG